MFKSGVAELEGGRRFGECLSKKTMGSRFPVLLAMVPGPVRVSTRFGAIRYRILPSLLPVGTHRFWCPEFVESQQKPPYANGGLSLGGNRTKADNRCLWAMGVRIPTAALVKAGRF